MVKYVYSFKEGNKDMKDILGGKGANLAEMTNIGLPVPHGFTITTSACLKYYENNGGLDKDIERQIFEKLAELERISGKKIGDKANPLLLSVRSGARASMPGMMDTILNLGINDEVAKNFSVVSGNPRFVYDSYRRFIQMFADVVMEFPKSSFEYLFDEIKKEKNIVKDSELSADDLKEVIEKYKAEYKKLAKTEFPQDPIVQLLEAVKAVFRSWNNDRAIAYRKLNDIPSSWGTAVNVQEMVYGNLNDNSGTGVAFTRNPVTGEKKLFGEYLINAQGEDVVAGIRTPQSIEQLNNIMPDCYNEFLKIIKILENHYKDMQDMEFTIENKKLYMLQTRNGKRTGQAALKIAVDLVDEGMISKEEALMRVEPKQLDQLLHPNFDSESLNSATVIAKGLASSPGAATGRIYFAVEDVINASKNGEKNIILVRNETSPEDIEGMNLASGVLTVRGGMTSHAAVVARGMGICCVTGCNEIDVDINEKTITFKNGKKYKEGDWISIDGSTGNVYGEKINTTEPEIKGDFETFMSWVDDTRKLKVRANADNERDALQARKLGAEGIGICRTEHMFFEPERLFNFRKMIIADTKEERKRALESILPYQRKDFESLFRAMAPYNVNIRYLDPPLHEFLPNTDKEIESLSKDLKVSFENLKQRIDSLREINPMMGHRGCRLAITYPEIAEMQTRAVIEAALNVKKEGLDIKPEIMVPLVSDKNELSYVKKIICETANKIIEKNNMELEYHVGTMIEVPRAALIADELAEVSEFFSFGTNDLTQLTYGFSRDDASKFLNDYYEKNILEADPFARIDENGVGKLMKIAIEKARSKNKNIKLGICGEHGGEKNSIEFCNKLGIDYVSCSPFRVPSARLAAAQAAIREKENK